MTPSPQLPPALLEVLQLIEPHARPRFRALCDAASRMMGALGDVDLSQFERELDSDEPYALWEKMAPLVGETTQTIHDLIRAADELFVPGQVDQFDAVGHAGLVASELSARLKMEVQSFRDDMRTPELMADHWRLLLAFGAFRGKIRARTGGAIYAIARAFLPDADEAEVTPHYQDDLAAALLVRNAVAQLLREARIFDAVLAGASDRAELESQSQLLLAMLESFSASEAYRNLRVADHRALRDAQRNLTDAIRDPSVDPTVTMRQVLDFLAFLEKINTRDNIVRHDREVVAAALGHIRRAHAALTDGLTRAGVEAQGATRLISRVAARDPRIDTLLERVQIDEVGNLGVDALIEHLAHVEGALALLKSDGL